MEKRETTVCTRDGTAIFVRAWVPHYPERVLLCVQGLGGHGGYYDTLAQCLVSTGTVVVAPDLRGHGQSEGIRGDIDRFDRYLEDIDAAVTWVCSCWPDTPLLLLGESMGASIAIQYIIRRQQQSSLAPVAALVLLSPVLRSAIQPTPREAVRYVRSLFGASTRPSMPTTGREELGCRDAAFNARLRADPLFVRQVSIRFLNTLTKWLWQTRRKASQITLPLLVLQGGQDAVAQLDGTAAFLRKVSARDQGVVTFPQAYHCLLYDPDTPSVMMALASWLAAYTSNF